MLVEYEDQEDRLEAIHQRASGWFDDFVHSPQYQALNKGQKERATAIIRNFIYYSCRHIGVSPEEWGYSTVA